VGFPIPASFVLDFARQWQAAEKIVYSRTLAEPRSARARIEREFDPGAVRRLKADAEHDITVDGPELAVQAVRASLVDEFQMIVGPVVVGSGKWFFPGGVRLNLELVEERRFRKGVIVLRYVVRGSIVVKGVERHLPTVAPAHAAIAPGQERCEFAVEAATHNSCTLPASCCETKTSQRTTRENAQKCFSQ